MEEDQTLLAMRMNISQHNSYSDLQLSQVLSEHYCANYCGDAAQGQQCHFKKVEWNKNKNNLWATRDDMCAGLCVAHFNSNGVCERNRQVGNTGRNWDLCEINTYYPNGEGRVWMDRIAADYCQSGCVQASGTACTTTSTDPKAIHICETYCSWQPVSDPDNSGSVMRSWQVLNPTGNAGTASTCMRDPSVADLCDSSSSCITNYLAVQAQSVLNVGDKCGCNGDCNAPGEARYCEGWTLHNCCAPGVGYGKCRDKKPDGSDCFTSAECASLTCGKKLGRYQCYQR